MPPSATMSETFDCRSCTASSYALAKFPLRSSMTRDPQLYHCSALLLLRIPARSFQCRLVRSSAGLGLGVTV